MSEQVSEIFTAANWTAGQKDGWNGSFIWSDASVIGGIDPWGTPRVTVVGTRSPEEAAAWLVQHAIDLRLAPESEPEKTPAHDAHGEATEQVAQAAGPSDEGGPDDHQQGDSGDTIAERDGSGDEGGDESDLGLGAEILEAAHEAHEETGAEADGQQATSPALDSFGGDDAFGESGGGTDLLGEPSLDLGSEILDADYTEPTDPPPEDHPSGAFIFGDNLPQMRTSAIGLVVQISLAKQEAIWTEAGAGPDEYSQLMSAVVRDTVDGTYRGDQATYDRFVALSTYDNAARRVQVYERDLVNMLTTADRLTIEGFDPEAGWP